MIEKRVALARYYGTQSTLEVDVLFKDLNLAVEHQGERHFFDVTLLGESRHWMDQDAEKAVICATLGLHLIEVPYWANENSKSLSQTIGHFVTNKK